MKKFLLFTATICLIGCTQPQNTTQNEVIPKTQPVSTEQIIKIEPDKIEPEIIQPEVIETEPETEKITIETKKRPR